MPHKPQRYEIIGSVVEMEILRRTGDIYKFTFDIQYLDLVKSYRWYCVMAKNTKYVRSVSLHGKILLHDLIMNPPKGFVVDHIDGNGLSNVVSNLRICTQQQNSANRVVDKDTTTGYKGVHKCNCKSKPFKASLRVDGKLCHLGYFKTPEEANEVREKASRDLHGDFFFNGVR